MPRYAIQDHKGKYVTTWDGPGLVANRDAIGEGEVFNLVALDAPEPPVPPVIPQPPGVPPYSTWTGSDRDWFGHLVYGKPFGQQTLLELESMLNLNGWLLTPPNANGDRTKVLPAGEEKPWVRVGFGEGYWVWVEQS